MTRAQPQAGFTLIELLVTIAIAAIMLTVAVPSFRDFILNSRMATQSNDLVLALTYAKSEAVKRNSSINVCKAADAATNCGGGNATGWSNGWTVLVDGDNDCVVDAGDQVLRVWPALQNNTLCFNNGVKARFANTGFSTNTAGTYTLCDSRGATEARGVVLSSEGRIRRATDSNADSIEDVNGANLACP